MCTAVLILLRPHNPFPAFGLIFKGAIGQPRKTTSLCDLLIVSQSPKKHKKMCYVQVKTIAKASRHKIYLSLCHRRMIARRRETVGWELVYSLLCARHNLIAVPLYTSHPKIERHRSL
jgi:hypothetical protein